MGHGEGEGWEKEKKRVLKEGIKEREGRDG
jgi:hypothetical protein